MTFNLNKGSELENAQKLSGRRERLYRKLTNLPEREPTNPVLPTLHSVARKIQRVAGERTQQE